MKCAVISHPQQQHITHSDLTGYIGLKNFSVTATTGFPSPSTFLSVCQQSCRKYVFEAVIAKYYLTSPDQDVDDNVHMNT
jgi:hypothetical protein